MTCCCCKLEKVSSSPGGALTQCIIQSCIKQSSISDLNCGVLSFPFPAARAASSAWQCPVCPRIEDEAAVSAMPGLQPPVPGVSPHRPHHQGDEATGAQICPGAQLVRTTSILDL